MAQPIEDYALLGDCHTAALVGRDGSLDWLCLPRFDSRACFAALLGDERDGRWRIAPAGGAGGIRRRYRGDTLVLETEIETDDGTIRIVDFMAPRGETREVVRIVEGVRGSVRVESELGPRFDYGRVTPWLRRLDGGVVAIAGPDGLWLRTPAESRIEDGAIRCSLVVGPGQRIPFVLSWRASHGPAPPAIDAFTALARKSSSARSSAQPSASTPRPTSRARWSASSTSPYRGSTPEGQRCLTCGPRGGSREHGAGRQG